MGSFSGSAAIGAGFRLIAREPLAFLAWCLVYFGFVTAPALWMISQLMPTVMALAQSAAAQGLAGQIETRLTNVVVAALKEAFERDHARLELERAQMEEQRRRAVSRTPAPPLHLGTPRSPSPLRRRASPARSKRV